MKFQGTIELHVQGEQLLRHPSLWDKVRRAFGGEPALATGQMRASLEAGALIDAVREALARLGATNAVSLVIDEVVLFQDREGRPDDLGELFLAFHEHAAVFGREFTLLRLAVEHEETGLHYVLEVIARREHPQDEPAARLVVAGRLRELEPRPGEDAEGYRRRVEPLTRDVGVFELHRRQFESFVARVADALRAALPEARVVQTGAEARVVRPSRHGALARRPAAAARPTDRHYDPHEAYYPNPFAPLLTFMVWDAMLHSAYHPALTVVDPSGHALGPVEDVAAAELSGVDPELGGVGEEGGDGGDGGDGDGGDWGDGGDGGGDGGFDFGDFDLGDFGGDW